MLDQENDISAYESNINTLPEGLHIACESGILQLKKLLFLMRYFNYKYCNESHVDVDKLSSFSLENI